MKYSSISLAELKALADPIQKPKQEVISKTITKPAFIGNEGEDFIAYNLPNVDNHMSSGWWGRNYKEIEKFKKSAKKDAIGTKTSKTYASAVRKWLKEVNPKYFYVNTKKATSGWWDDSIDVWYVKGE